MLKHDPPSVNGNASQPRIVHFLSPHIVRSDMWLKTCNNIYSKVCIKQTLYMRTGISSVVFAHQNFLCDIFILLFTLFYQTIKKMLGNPYTSSIASYEQGFSKQGSPITTVGGSAGCWDPMKAYLWSIECRLSRHVIDKKKFEQWYTMYNIHTFHPF